MKKSFNSIRLNTLPEFLATKVEKLQKWDLGEGVMFEFVPTFI